MDSVSPATVEQGSSSDQRPDIDLVGEPFAVLESDPRVFTSLLHRLGVTGLELDEVYSIDAEELDSLQPKALIFCYNEEELQEENLSDDEEAKSPARAPEGFWFANQVVADACATIAVLNITLNLPESDPDVHLGEELSTFLAETRAFDSKMKGLAISNSRLLRDAHNALARPADRRAAQSSLIIKTMAEAREAAKPKAKRRKTKAYSDSVTDTFHYIAYLPYSDGKVYELDGYSLAPVPVASFANSAQTWTDALRPTLIAKMGRLGGIRTNMLALVPGKYELAHDRMELLKRRKVALERRMGEDFAQKVDRIARATSGTAFSTPSNPSPLPSDQFSKGFGAKAMETQRQVLTMPEDDLSRAWERCVEDALEVKQQIEELIARDRRAQEDHLQRTHDYEPFIRAYIRTLAEEGLLDDLLEGVSKADNGASHEKNKKGTTRGRGRGRGRRGKR